MSGGDARLRRQAADVLIANDRGEHTVPSPRLYPHQWAWDSAFAAIGWAELDPARGVTELESLLAARWPDGRVPHIRFDPEAEGYFPGPEIWRTVGTSTITQPPLWATAARRLLERGADPDRIAALLPGIEQSHAFFLAQRDPLGWGAVAVAHPWESGLDNSPAWDEPMAAVDPSEAPPFQRVDVGIVDDPEMRPTDLDYKRYIVLVDDIAADRFGPGRFAVYDPMMTALLARAEEDLAALGDALDWPTEAARRASRIQEALLELLWDPAAGRFRFHDAVADRSHMPDVLAAYVPLILDLPDAVEQTLVTGLEARYDTPWPLPSTPPDSAAYDPRRYWRGPTWINMNWLLIPRLGEALYESTLDLLTRSGFREYYHPETGEGLGAEEFTWSAALALDLLR